ncbi:MAG: alpha/beta hydrolase [Acidobacteriaceae bacterium]|nr:alpha/beta hydrolase [Acidobacteriaceae bacterium]MBV9306043.1 alpha/beta hydrolase [Acidobacteriaceae bacterium]
MRQRIVDRFVYYPMRYPQGEWDLQGSAGAQDHWFNAADGTRLNAWWFPRPDARFGTLFLHGNAGNVTHRVDHAHQVLAAGSAFLVVDYRGYGKSQGSPSERGFYQDGDAAYADLLALGYAPNQIILQGESLGTAVAVDLALRKPCAGLILESPLKSLRAMAGTVLPGVGPLLAGGFDTYNKIQRVHVPTLIIHGNADEIVPFPQGQAVFQAANQPKQFWPVSGAHHNDLLYQAGPEYIMRLQAFYRSISPNAH